MVRGLPGPCIYPAGFSLAANSILLTGIFLLNHRSTKEGKSQHQLHIQGFQALSNPLHAGTGIHKQGTDCCNQFTKVSCHSASCNS